MAELAASVAAEGASMSGNSEWKRGAKEAGQQLAVLREKWPAAFPVKLLDVRPLAAGAPGEIAAAMGWSLHYTRGVLIPWKMSPAYCQAVLAHAQRITLDGSLAEAVDAEAKDLATKRLEQIAAKKAAPKKATPAPAKPKTAPPPKAPASLRDRVRASLGRRG
jgi:sRNA-binding protein